MGRPPLRIDIAPKHQRELTKLLSGGVQQVRVVLRALALLQLAKGPAHRKSPTSSRSLPRPYAILAVATSKAGWSGRCNERQRPGAAEVLDDRQKQRLIAMVCS